ncbi:MAG: FAD-dependent oxidoreductase [Gammaproteobacteria bacterium]|nr:FAD-dependent oxidoreductase [Gammaproteobacteria bacterium]MBT8150895.1 FAD-dependent oxidoreductase [Gammaproteobacteria bacterium]NND38317.1 FAD-dependent oxidoreductase [Pseudomonadales bacterium]NNM11455.1 FAD-dependent oxidoreductase [Pseudomonadales bacterium]RZV53700.1 MAG: pyridine nucleotide-disulfide oxidoreductase [Pseudomonadales bacterium]
MKKMLFALLIAALLAVWFSFDLGQTLTLDNFLARKAELEAYVAKNFFPSLLLFSALYAASFALALPIGAVLTLAGGALFGLGWGVVSVSFASSIGSLLAFLAARYLLRDWVKQRFAQRMQSIDDGVQRDGAFYLFTLRLVPIFPPALINLVMGLTSMRGWTFYWVSQLGMLAGTIVYVNAGTALGKVSAGEPILTPGLIAAFVLLGVFPLLARRFADFVRARKVYAPFKKPRQFDANMLVIGAGSGGLVSAYIAAQVGASVTLVEREKMGGDCLNTGCVPSKTLLRSAKIAHYIRRADEFGLKAAEPQTDFTAVMQRVRDAIAAIEPHDSVERYTSLGVDCVQGNATLVSPWAVQVDGREITARNIVIATGGRPRMLSIEGADQIPLFNSDTIWELREQPGHLLVIGAGPIGCELAQAFARLGSKVTILSHGEQVLAREDCEVGDYVRQRLAGEGISFAMQHDIKRFENNHGQCRVIADHAGEARHIEFSHALMAVGRQANTERIGLEQLGVETGRGGTVPVDDFLRTKFPNVYAVGDVAGPYQFTHTASHQAWYAAVNGLFGSFKRFRVDYSVIPWATFTDPEVAHVGLNEREANKQGINYEVTRYDLSDLDRAIADGEAAGFVKVLTPPGKDKILGATIVGYHAGEMLNEFIATMKRGGKLGDILGTIHIYPTLGEANKFVAGEWRKARKPEKLLAIVRRFFAWQRS